MENTDYLNIKDTTANELSKSLFDVEDKESDRLKKFESSFHYVFKLIASGVTFEKFKEIFDSQHLLHKHPKSLIKLYKMFKESLEDSCVKNLEEMISEAELEAKFKKLANILEQNAPYIGEKAWRPTGNIEDDVRSYIMVEKVKLVEDLEEKVLEKEAAVESLITEVNVCREKARTIESTELTLISKTEAKHAEELQKIQKQVQLMYSL